MLGLGFAAIFGLLVNQPTDTEQKMQAAGAAAYVTKERAVDELCPVSEAPASHTGRTDVQHPYE
jgi:hypothetical protein